MTEAKHGHQIDRVELGGQRETDKDPGENVISELPRLENQSAEEEAGSHKELKDDINRQEMAGLNVKDTGTQERSSHDALPPAEPAPSQEECEGDGQNPEER